MFNTFSIRYKILMLLTVVSFISGIILLYTSMQTFKKDKIAYIFETNTNVASQFSEQLSRELQTVNQALALYAGRFSKTGSLSEDEFDEIPESSILSGVQIFSLNNKKLLQISSIKKVNSKLIQIDDPKLGKSIQNLGLENKDFFYFNEQLYFLQQFSFNTDNYIIVYFYKSEIFNSFFKQDSSHKSFLINTNGEVVLSDLVTEENFLNNNFGDFFKNQKASTNLSTSMIRSKNNDRWLLTTVQTPLKNLSLIILVNEKNALSALAEIITKSVLIFIILFAAVIIVGIFSANYITSRLSLLSDHARKVTDGDFSSSIIPKGHDEVTDLTQHFNKMTLELSRLMQATANKARMEAELKTAQAVQETLFPKNEYISDKIQISGHYQSASECGGDWWSYTENEDNIFFWIADATGHGVSAALLTSAAKSTVTLIEEMNLSAEENMKILNKAIRSVAKEKLMMTCFHGIYHKSSRTLTYVNASHEPPIVFKKSEDIHTKSSLVFLNDNINGRLGYSADTEYISSEFLLEENDRIYFYTDGVQDVTNGQGIVLGERGHLKNLLQILNSKLELNNTKQTLVQSLESFREKAELVDDVTFFFMEVK